MHLLNAQTGIIDGEAEAIDLGQSPADIIILSAADSELACLARAHDSLTTPPDLRLANIMTLGHNLSIDTYIERTASHAKLIIARVLGGKAYWNYGVNQLVSLAHSRNIKLVLLPGGADPDAELTALSTLSQTDCERIRQYLTS